MFETLRALLNNINERKYITNRYNLSYELVRDGEEKNIIKKSVDDVAAEMERLQTGIRYNNLKLFATCYSKAKLKQFTVYTLPAILVAANLFLWFSPAQHVKVDSLDAYKLVEDVVTEDSELIDYLGNKTYYYSFMGRDFVDDNAEDLLANPSDKIYFQIRDDLDGFLAKINIDSSGKLSLESIEDGKFIDLTEYDFSESSEVSKEYLKLFDEIIELIIDSGYLNDNNEARLLDMSESDKRDILIRILHYEELGKQDVEVYKSNWFWRIALLIVAAIYIWADIYIRYSGGPYESTKLENNDGELDEAYGAEFGLSNLGLKYKRIFIKAEHDRIMRIYDLARENLDFNKCNLDDVLTSYEKKLIFKEKE